MEFRSHDFAERACSTHNAQRQRDKGPFMRLPRAPLRFMSSASAPPRPRPIKYINISIQPRLLYITPDFGSDKEFKITALSGPLRRRLPGGGGRARARAGPASALVCGERKLYDSLVLTSAALSPADIVMKRWRLPNKKEAFSFTPAPPFV
ncbi:hypothetical protein EVAR_32159_1 [Eumeta japonica]|uniref:Uncharacterized protein n=1 Tax=Eumeta variegata TaxID=151549 RepID=A0A4C1VXS5_EUMVA|nr:hypothetical protein EVAR_32159_1 [Eumeta japonica]